MSNRRSYDLKLDRAEKHLVDLEGAIRRYSDSHPYEVREGREGKGNRRVWRLHFTKQPDDEIALIAADFIYNVRSALDHLAAALVPPNRRSSVMFPIFWAGVWEPAIEEENPERGKARERWASCITGMDDGAIAILQANQPPDLAPGEDNVQALAMLNRIRNKDAHSKLPVIAHSLIDIQGGYFTPDGSVEGFVLDLDSNEGLVDGAELGGLPDDAVNVQIKGSAQVFLRVGQIKGGYLIEGAFRVLLLDGMRRLIDALRPFDRL